MVSWLNVEMAQCELAKCWVGSMLNWLSVEMAQC